MCDCGNDRINACKTYNTVLGTYYSIDVSYFYYECYSGVQFGHGRFEVIFISLVKILKVLW